MIAVSLQQHLWAAAHVLGVLPQRRETAATTSDHTTTTTKNYTTTTISNHTTTTTNKHTTTTTDTDAAAAAAGWLPHRLMV